MALLDHKEDEAHVLVFLKMWFSCSFGVGFLKEPDCFSESFTFDFCATKKPPCAA